MILGKLSRWVMKGKRQETEGRSKQLIFKAEKTATEICVICTGELTELI